MIPTKIIQDKDNKLNLTQGTRKCSDLSRARPACGLAHAEEGLLAAHQVGHRGQPRAVLRLNPQGRRRGQRRQAGHQGVRQGEDGEVGQAGEGGRQVGEGVVVHVELLQSETGGEVGGEAGEEVVGEVEALEGGEEIAQGRGEGREAVAGEGGVAEGGEGGEAGERSEQDWRSWRDEFDDGLDSEYRGDAEDRRRLEALTEKEREEEIYRRAERRDELRRRFDISQKLREQQLRLEGGQVFRWGTARSAYIVPCTFTQGFH